MWFFPLPDWARVATGPSTPAIVRRAVPLPLWGAAQAAGLRGDGHSRSAGLPYLADKALGLALRGAPGVLALAVIVVDPEHAREHVHTRFPDGAQQGVMMGARRLHEPLELVPRLGALLVVLHR